MHKIKEICSCRTLLDNNREFVYRYFLTEGTKELEVNVKKIVVPCYGISIVKEENLGGNTMNIDEESLECLTSNREKALNLVKTLRDHEVSPIHLYDIVGEMADEWVSDFESEATAIASSIM